MSRHFANLSASTCLIALCMAVPVRAQTAPAVDAIAAGAPTANTPAAPSPASPAAVEPDRGVADIIVTAQRRSESLQKTALTISVVSPRALSVVGVTNAAQLTSILPTVQIGTSGPASAVYIRGVGGFAATVSQSPAVPYYIDGVYVARTQALPSEFYDIDRLELVKGPQGTLYGRNASGGAINVLTRRPVLGKFEVRGLLEAGNYGDQTGELALNLPIGDTIALRASGTLVDKGGYTSVGFGDDVHQSGRIKALWQPSSNISLLLNGSYGHIGGKASGVVALNRDILGWYPWLDISDPRTQAYITATSIAPPPFVRPSQPSDARQDLKFYNFSAQFDADVGVGTLTIIPAYRYAKYQYSGMFGFTLNNGYDLGSFPDQPLTSKASSLETRLSGSLGRLNYVFGLFYDNEDQTEQFTINGGFIQNVGQRTVVGTRSYAAFGQLNFAIADHLRLIGGLRYTADRRKLAGETYLLAPSAFLGPPPPQAIPCAFPAPTKPQCLIEAYTGSKTFKNASFKTGFEADVFDNSLLYATVSRGFKAGGFNDQSAIGSPGQALAFQPEKLTSFESGLKSRFLDNRLQVNVSTFYWDYKNHQEPVLTYTNVPGVTNLVFLNAGASRIYGATLDLVARPWTGGTISSAVEYIHSKYRSFNKTIPTFAYDPRATGCRVASQDPANTRLDCSGFQVSRTPSWAGNVSLTQEVAVGAGKLIGNGTLGFASVRWLGTDFIPIERVKGYGKLDLSLTYQAPGDHVSLTGFVRNVTNATVYTEAAKNPFSAAVYGNIQPPRTYGVQLGFNF